MNDEPAPSLPPFSEALRFWIKLGFISFGGPAGQIAIMHTELVERKRWLSESHFLHALNFCMLLPGPDAQQLATYLGWRLHGVRGGIAAGTLFVLPSMFILFGLSWLYVVSGTVPWSSVSAPSPVSPGRPLSSNPSIASPSFDHSLPRILSCVTFVAKTKHLLCDLSALSGKPILA